MQFSAIDSPSHKVSGLVHLGLDHLSKLIKRTHLSRTALTLFQGIYGVVDSDADVCTRLGLGGTSHALECDAPRHWIDAGRDEKSVGLDLVCWKRTGGVEYADSGGEFIELVTEVSVSTTFNPEGTSGLLVSI